MKNYLAIILMLSLIPSVFATQSTSLSPPNTFVDGTVADASEVNENFTTLYNDYILDIGGDKIDLGGQAQGDIMYFNGTSWDNLAAGTSGYFLKTQGASANPVWAHMTLVHWKDNSSVALDLSSSDDVAFTALDLTTHTSTTATKAILQIVLNNTTSGEYCYCRVRKNGSSQSGNNIPGAMTPDEAYHSQNSYTTVIVGMDSGQVIEYEIDTESTAAVTAQIIVLGYIE